MCSILGQISCQYSGRVQELGMQKKRKSSLKKILPYLMAINSESKNLYEQTLPMCIWSLTADCWEEEQLLSQFTQTQLQTAAEQVCLGKNSGKAWGSTCGCTYKSGFEKWPVPEKGSVWLHLRVGQ